MLLPMLACLQGILAGCWIVGSGWVRACLEAGGTLLPEEPFEVQGDGSSGSNGGGCSVGGSDGCADGSHITLSLFVDLSAELPKQC